MATLNEDSRRYLFDRSAPAVGDIAALESLLSRKKYRGASARSGRPAVALAASVLLGLSLALWMPGEAGVKTEGSAIDVGSNSELSAFPNRPWDLQSDGAPDSEGPDKSAPFVVLIGGELGEGLVDRKPQSIVPQVELGTVSTSEVAGPETLSTRSAAD